MEIDMNTDWSQKYRPTKLEEVILPSNIKSKIEKVVNQKGGLSLLFWGKPGCGKTTVGQLINPENTFRIDCTTDRSIEMVRGLDRFCSSCTLDGGRRLVLLDEADHLHHTALNAFRGVIEKCSNTTDFVMTANNPNQISEPIRSRCLPIHFDLKSDPDLLERFKSRVYEILRNEGIENYDKYAVDEVIQRGFPDLRRTLKQLQLDFS
jgi:replication factor C subunit 3/5